MKPPTQHEIGLGLERGQILPYFQPLVDLRTGRLTGFEILARWNHPRHGLVSPTHFITLAETSGMIQRITDSLLCQAFRAAKDLPQPICLAINIAPVQLRDSTLPQRIQVIAEGYKFPLERLTVEITESALMGDLDQAKVIAEDLKSLGINLALDDFGTGYSSLHHLQCLPFDELKVDQSFVRSMLTKRESRKIVAAVVGLGRSLGLTTVAEGIEERAQADMLLCLGCDLGQGWLYGRPVPANEIEALIELPTLLPPPPMDVRLQPPDLTLCLEAVPSQRYAQLQAIYDGAPVGLCFLDCDLRYVSLNRRLTEMDGVPLHEHLGRTVEDVVPHIYEQAEFYLKQSLQGESVSGVELNAFNPDAPGEQITLLASYQPARDEAGEIVGVSVAVGDISQRKRVEEAQRRDQVRLQAVIDAVPVGIVIAEAPSGKIVCINPAAQKILPNDPIDYERIADYARDRDYFYDGARLHADKFPLSRAITHGETAKLEPVLYKLGNGAERYISLIGAPIMDEKNAIVGGVAVIQEAQNSK